MLRLNNSKRLLNYSLKDEKHGEIGCFYTEPNFDQLSLRVNEEELVLR